jgi:hypothetical protein
VTTPQRRERRHRILEIMAVALLGIATLGSAWCGYQATSWNSEENELARAASGLQVEGAREFGLAVQTVSYDAAMIAEYARAVADEDEALQGFVRESLIRPDFLPVLTAWEADIAAGGQPTNLLGNQAYLDERMESYRETITRAEATALEAAEAGSNADDYVLTTLLLAAALFFAGLTTSFRVRFAQVLLLAGASVLIAMAAARLVDLPVV